jgi:hypothetical protein
MDKETPLKDATQDLPQPGEENVVVAEVTPLHYQRYPLY